MRLGLPAELLLVFGDYLLAKADPDPAEIISQYGIDGLLDMLGKVEKSLAELYLHSWDSAVRNAILAASAPFAGKKGRITEEELNQALAILSQELGPKLQTMTAEQAGRLITSAYLVGRHLTGRMIDFMPRLQQIDEAAMAWLKQDNLFWIGEFYDAQLGATIADAVRTLAIEQGLGRVDVGRALESTFGAQFGRSSWYWRGLAATVVERARNFGGVQSMLEAEVEEYRILPVGDERTCSVCATMALHTFRVEHAVELRDSILAARSPQEVKSIHPWLPYKEVSGLTTQQLVERGQSLPPYHYMCRCTYVVTSFRTVTVQNLSLDLKVESPSPGPGLPADLAALEYLGSGAYLGGAGEKHLYRDPGTGQVYLFKPAVSKSGVPEAFRAYVQEAVSEIAKRIYDAGEYIEIRVLTDPKGRLGTLQRLLPDVAGDLKAIPWQSLTVEQIKQIQREHVLDWVIGNFDSHPGNFIAAGGRVYGIDKEQAFRYLKDSRSWQMSLTYHPNAVYGEVEPLYNTLYRAFAQGEVDLDLQTVLPALQRLEAISDAEFRAILRPYAEALYGRGQAAEDLLDLAVKRKVQVREEYKRFFTELLKARYPGHKGTVFRFADELTAAGLDSLPLAAKVLSKDELERLDVKSLKQLAKTQKIVYYHQMTKAELVEALADPSRAASVSLQARERLRRRIEAARKVIPLPTRRVGAGVLDDLDNVPAVRHGVVIRGDGKMVEGQQLQCMRVNDDGRPGWEIVCKVRDEYHNTVMQQLRQQGAVPKNLDPGVCSWQNGVLQRTIHDSYGYQYAGLELQDPNGRFRLRFIPNSSGAKALRGEFRMTIYGQNGAEAAKLLHQQLDQMGLGEILRIPTTEDDEILRLSRLLWQYAPREAAQFPEAQRTVEELRRILQASGIDPERAAKLVEREVFPGYTTYIEPGITKRYKELGADYLFAGVGPNPRIVADILSPESPGLASTRVRFLEGVGSVHTGKSWSEDLISGGADSAFTRLVPKSARGKYRYSEHFAGGGYRLIIDPRVLERTDWYAYGSDVFGRTDPEEFNRRLSAENFIQRLSQNYRTGNEVMFRRGIDKSFIIGITCDTDYQRDALLLEFRNRGISEVNGVSIEKFVKVKVKL